MPKKNGFVLVIFHPVFHPDGEADGAVAFTSKASLKKYFLKKMVHDMVNIDSEELALYVQHVKDEDFWAALEIYNLELEEEHGFRMELFDVLVWS